MTSYQMEEVGENVDRGYIMLGYVLLWNLVLVAAASVVGLGYMIHKVFLS